MIYLKLIVLIGNTDVGKMTVGQALTQITDLRLFHNHIIIKPVLEVFGHFNINVITKMRDVVFEEFASSNHYGLIFTYMMAFDQKSDWNYLEHVSTIFKKNGADVYYVELVAPPRKLDFKETLQKIV